MVRLAEVPVADRPVACRADVGVGAAMGIALGYAVEALEALGLVDRGRWDFDHERTRSNTRPRNQKLSTPAQKA